MFHAGKHLILDCLTNDVKNLIDYMDSRQHMNSVLVRIGATVLHSNFHSFGENEGYTGIFMLSESHLSIHTWPEKSFFSLDIYTCGDVDPIDAKNPILDFFKVHHYTCRYLNREMKL